MSNVTVKDFRGWLNLTDPKNIDDNQFEVLTNMFYNKDKRIQTRLGLKKFKNVIPESTQLISAADTTTNWAVSDDGASLATGTAIRGTFSLQFWVDVSATVNDFATLTNSTLGTIDITGNKGHLGFFINVPTGFNTNLTDIKIRLGSSSSDYYEWTLAALTESQDEFIRLDFADATTTGTPVDTSIDFFRLQITYTGSYLDQAGIRIDDINTYSETSTKPVTSYFFHKRDDNQQIICIVTVGTNMYLLDNLSDEWTVIDTGLTEFETKIGSTTDRTRWDFVVYRNIVYMCNGLDDYRKWNGTIIETFWAQPKVRYLAFLADTVFGAGDDENPSTLYWISPGAGNADAISTNLVVVGWDELGQINGITELGQFVLAGKSRKVYTIDIVGKSALPIDAQNGLYSNRATKNVANSIVFYSDNGVNNLQQKKAAVGAQAIENAPLSDDIRDLLDQIEPWQRNASCALYAKELNNYYFSFDATNDNIPEKTVVLSSLVPKAWSTYTYPAAYDYGLFIDDSNVESLILASANVGQLFEIETGFTDNDITIPYEIRTKQWDMNNPSQEKVFNAIDIFGLKSLGEPIEVDIIVDWEVVSGAIIDDTFLDFTSSNVTIGTTAIGIEAIGGWGSRESDTIDTFPYKVRIPMYAMGETIQICMKSDTTPITWTLDRLRIDFDAQTMDIFPISNLA